MKALIVVFMGGAYVLFVLIINLRITKLHEAETLILKHHYTTPYCGTIYAMSLNGRVLSAGHRTDGDVLHSRQREPSASVRLSRILHSERDSRGRCRATGAGLKREREIPTEGPRFSGLNKVSDRRTYIMWLEQRV